MKNMYSKIMQTF